MLNIEFIGDLYDEKCNLYYNNNILYSGYVDDLVTSVDDCLMLKLNYGKDTTYIMILKKLQDNIFFIPKDNIDLNIYENIIVNVSEIEMLWNKIGYDFDDDIDLIKDIDKQDLKLLWLINSKGIRRLEDKVVNKIKNRIIPMVDRESSVQDMFYYLLSNSWDNIELEVIRKSLNNENSLVIYTEYENKVMEWVPLFYKGERNIILNLGCEWEVLVLGARHHLK